MTIEPLPPLLEDKILARCDQLPLKPEPVTLQGRFVRLVPLSVDRDSGGLYAVSNGASYSVGDKSIDAYDAEERIWRFMQNGPFATPEAFTAYLQTAVNSKDGLAFCVRDLVTDQPVGMATYMNNVPPHLKIELGGIWYSPLAQGTLANTEATYLMLRHAFDLGYRRLEWKCNALNERSRRAALRLGFKFEGIQESHFIIKGRSRDTAWFRILDREWSDVKKHLESLLGGNF